MEKQNNKLIAPIIITAILIAYFIFYILGTLFIEAMPIPLNILFIIIPIGLIILSIAMLIERIKEVKGGN